jgi:pimeloyl-ACP methyl ester carboxylesterase
MPGSRYMFWHGKGQAAAPFTPEQLGHVTQPTLIIWGEQDRFFPIEHAKTACQLIPDARLQIIPDAAHCPYISNPGDFCAAVYRFIDD